MTPRAVAIRRTVAHSGLDWQNSILASEVILRSAANARGGWFGGSAPGFLEEGGPRLSALLQPGDPLPRPTIFSTNGAGWTPGPEPTTVEERAARVPRSIVNNQQRAEGVTDPSQKGTRGQAAAGRAAPPSQGRNGKVTGSGGRTPRAGGSREGSAGKSPDGGWRSPGVRGSARRSEQRRVTVAGRGTGGWGGPVGR